MSYITWLNAHRRNLKAYNKNVSVSDVKNRRKIVAETCFQQKTNVGICYDPIRVALYVKRPVAYTIKKAH